jgi:predicted ester cyclase
MDIHSDNKAALKPFREALYNFNADTLKNEMSALFSPTAKIHLFHPLGDMEGPDAFYREAFLPLAKAIPDLERRDSIVMAGPTVEGHHWVGCCGYYTGSFSTPWLNIPASGHMVSLRFHEFYRFEQGQVVEVQAIWDIPELMMQASAWPMSPSLGREWHVPSPALQNGLSEAPRDEAQSQNSYDLVMDMCEGLSRYAEEGVSGMALDRYWHPRCSWYGPSGIGTARGLEGFRNWHQIPFLNGLPDRVGDAAAGHFFAEGEFAGFTAWPGMHMSVTGDGWLGIAAAGQKITMRSLDFWRCENELIRENWVLIDLLHVYDQLGVDVLARMRELNKARYPHLS